MPCVGSPGSQRRSLVCTDLTAPRQTGRGAHDLQSPREDLGNRSPADAFTRATGTTSTRLRQEEHQAGWAVETMTVRRSHYRQTDDDGV
jgi:hypothetical protein